MEKFNEKDEWWDDPQNISHFIFYMADAAAGEVVGVVGQFPLREGLI